MGDWMMLWYSISIRRSGKFNWLKEGNLLPDVIILGFMMVINIKQLLEISNNLFFYAG